MKLLKTGKVEVYSEEPIRQWESQCKTILQHQKITKIKKQGAEITYPVGTVENLEPQHYPSWLKHVALNEQEATISSPWGDCLVKAIHWEEEFETKEHVDLPDKPEPIPGFKWESPNQVCDLINRVANLDWHVTHFDLKTPRDGCYEFSYQIKKENVGETYKMGDREDGFHDYQDVKTTYNKMKIFPSFWELWEYEETFPVFKGNAAANSTTSREADGMWNK